MNDEILKECRWAKERKYMKEWKNVLTFICLLMFIIGYQSVEAQQNLAQQAYAIFEQNCLNCHGEHGAYTEQLIIEHTALVAPGGAIIPGNPQASEFYQRLIETAPEKRMPLNAPPLSQAAIDTIQEWIAVGAPDWRDTLESDGPFITPKEMLETIENHVNSLSPFDRPFARYFTLTHLYNAGETTEALLAYRRALSKLVNSLSWGRKVTNPQPIDSEETIFYIDLRDYEWEIGTNRWTLIEAEYPYGIEFNAPTQTTLREKLTNLREAMDCEVPFMHVDWFLATASLPPLYHDILGLPETDRELETRLEVNVVENLRNAAGRRVWRAGFNDSGVSNHNRVVERHESRYGAYWKSYDFAGSVGTQHIFTHPLSFTHDGGEIIFNLPNGLQAYYLADAGGNRLNEAPIAIVRNPAASDPTVRNGLSCMGCHTEGMKEFEDQVRGVVEQNENPPFDKDRALQLYTDQATMNALVAEDTERYRQALEQTGGVFGGIEPIQRFHEAFQGPVDVAHAAAAVGLETAGFLEKISENASLKNLGLAVLTGGSGTVKRDVWTSNFSEIVDALDFPSRGADITINPKTEVIPGGYVHIPDPNLRVVIIGTLGKEPNVPITIQEMESLERLDAQNKSIKNLEGLELATNLSWLSLRDNQISDLSPLAALNKLHRLWLNNNPISDLSPLKGLTNLIGLVCDDTRVSDLSPLTELINLEVLGISSPRIFDLSPLSDLKNLTQLWGNGIKVSDLSPLAGLINLEWLWIWGSPISDLSPLAGLTKLNYVDICGGDIPDLKPLIGLTNLKSLFLAANKISDISPLAEMTWLNVLSVRHNNVSDISPLAGLTNLQELRVNGNNISDFSPLDRIRENITTLLWHDNPGFPEGGPKMEGPGLWIVLPEANPWVDADLLSEQSEGTVTEKKIATLGAIEGQSVGRNVWIAYKLPSTRRIADVLEHGISDGTAYGSIFVYSPLEQDTTIYVGSGDELKVWFNGDMIHQNTRYLGGPDYTGFYPVTLQQGQNVLLVMCHPSRHVSLGFEPGTEYAVISPGTGFALLTDTTDVRVGETFTLRVNAEKVADLAGWQFNLTFDPDVLEVVEVNEGDFLKTDGGTTFFQQGTVDNAGGKIADLSSALISKGGITGTGVLLSVVFSAKADGNSQLTLHNFQLGSSTGAVIPAGVRDLAITVESKPSWDVNADGQVSVLDLILVAQRLGETATANSKFDVNDDGIISILDLILVAQHLGESTVSAAPSMTAEELNPAMIQAWIAQAQIENDGSLAFQQGIANLQRLLALLIPEETALLPNYPNPFNPETWIPYQLSEPAEVTLTIYAVNGTKVRTLALGLMPAGIYQSRSRAAYWDGRNNVGEPVASGVYFYTLTAGEFTSTRKMLIRK